MNKLEFREMLCSLADAWTRRDYEKAASFFADDVRYADPLNYSFANREDLKKFFINDEGFEQKTTWHTIIFDEEEQTGAAEYTYEGTHRYHGTALIKIKDDKVTHWREYQHIDKREWEEFASGTIF